MGKYSPVVFNDWLRACRVTPASTTTSKSSTFGSDIWVMALKFKQTDSGSTAQTPPSIPVPVPNGITTIFSFAQILTTSETSLVLFGDKTTAAGREVW